MPLLSICIPVYNGEKYIDNCLKTLISMKDVEIIIVDDGSQDNSLKQLNSYKDKYSNIILKSQTNAGQSEARNKALELATGKYITFVDIDDWLDSRAIDYLKDIDEKNNPDFIQFGVTSEFGTFSSSKKLLYSESKLLDEQESKMLYAYICGYKDDQDLGHDYFGLVSCKFYKRELVKDIRFVSNIVGEDTLFAAMAGKKVRSSYFLSEYLYHYSSIDNSYSHRLMKDIIPKSSKMLGILKKELNVDNSKDELMIKAYYNHAFSKFMWCLKALKFYTINESNYRIAILQDIFSHSEYVEMLDNIDILTINEGYRQMLELLKNKEYEIVASWRFN